MLAMLSDRFSVIASSITSHMRCQDVCWGGGVVGTQPTPHSLASVVHTFEAVAGSWGSVNAPAVHRVIEIAKQIWVKRHLGRDFVNVVSLKYIGMIYIL